MSQFAVYIVPHEFQSIKKLPGNVRQRIKRAIDELADNPRPPNSKRLDVGDVQKLESEVRRLRIDNWRILYLIATALQESKASESQP